MKPQKPLNWFGDEQPFCPQLTVYETAPEPIDTGLVGADGTKLFRRSEPLSIGFDLTPRKR